jgi:hypothetical protein
MRKPRIALALALAGPLLLLATGPGLAQSAYGDDYESGDYGRVRHAPDGVSIVRAEWDSSGGGPEEGGINSPVFPGDSIVTASPQRAEVQLARGSVVWVDEGTEVAFLSLPDPYADIADTTLLQLAGGRLRLAVLLGDKEEFRVDTPASTVYPLGNADLRIETDGAGRTRVFSRGGVAEVVGAGGSVILRGGMGTEILPGSVPSDPAPASTFAGDGFDRWVEQREREHEYRDARAEAAPEVYEELPQEVRPYYRELSDHGRWVHEDGVGWVWSPTVAADWRPYYDGYWAYGANGYFWVSYEPWGWAPYHYGRWTWIGPHGWCWSPGSVFAGAWVAWSWGSLYVGWSALDYWNYPAYRHSWYHGYYDPYAWTFVGYRHLHYRHYDDCHVGYDEVARHGHHSAAVTRPPRVSPRDLSRSEESRQQAVRRVQEDATARIRPVTDRRERPAADHGFRAAERRTGRVPDATGRPALAGSRAVRDRQGLGDGAAPAPAARSGRSPDRSDRLPVVTEPRYPRKLTTTETNRKPARSGAAKKPAAAPSVEPLGTSERLRDIYRQMARPRSTRERDSSGSADRPQTTRVRTGASPREPGGDGRSKPPAARPPGGDGRSSPPPAKQPGRDGKSNPPAAREGPSRSSAPENRPSMNRQAQRREPQTMASAPAPSRRSPAVSKASPPSRHPAPRAVHAPRGPAKSPGSGSAAGRQAPAGRTPSGRRGSRG